ncbi:hypothetical protein Dimus_000096 [Dionaea muscipula]
MPWRLHAGWDWWAPQVWSSLFGKVCPGVLLVHCLVVTERGCFFFFFISKRNLRRLHQQREGQCKSHQNDSKRPNYVDPFDHSPMIIRLLDNLPRPKPIFRFLNAWGLHADFLPLIRGTCMFQIMHKLRTVKGLLQEFHRVHFARMDGRILAAREVMFQAQKQSRIGCTDHEKGIMDKATAAYKELILAEEVMLKQKLKQDWFSLMDRCSPYFLLPLRVNRGEEGSRGF